MVTFRQFDEDLKKKWHGTNDKVSAVTIFETIDM